MAESQVPYTYNDNGILIEKNLSTQRFYPYLKRAGFNREYAFNLYLYNARLSKSFLFPLHVLEVVFRNSINEIFIKEYGNTWPFDINFQNNLTTESLSSLMVAINRANSNSTDSIVSGLSFDFWSNLFRPEYHSIFWQKLLPLMLPLGNISRQKIQSRARDINFFRNRIAHHEPIHHRDIVKIHDDIIEMISWFCFDTSDWVRYHSTLNTIMRTSPNATNEPKPHYIDRVDRNFTRMNENETISNLPKKSFIICNDCHTGEVKSILDKKDMAEFLLSLVDSSGCLMEDLKNYSLEDIIKKQKTSRNFHVVSANESFLKSYNFFKDLNISHLLVVDSNGKVCGVISKSHRRY